MTHCSKYHHYERSISRYYHFGGLLLRNKIRYWSHILDISSLVPLFNMKILHLIQTWYSIFRTLIWHDFFFLICIHYKRLPPFFHVLNLKKSFYYSKSMVCLLQCFKYQQLPIYRMISGVLSPSDTMCF